MWADRTCQRKSHEGNCQTSLVKLRSAGHRKTAEPAEHGGSPDETGTSLTCLLSAGQRRRDCSTLRKAGLSRMSTIFVPVVDQAQRPLMPTTPARARRWIKSAKATPFWKGGLFCVRLNVDPRRERCNPWPLGSTRGRKKRGWLSPRRLTPTLISRLMPARGSRKLSRRKAACAAPVGDARLPVASPGRTANGARRSSRLPPGRDGSGNYGWRSSSAGSSR